MTYVWRSNRAVTGEGESCWIFLQHGRANLPGVSAPLGRHEEGRGRLFKTQRPATYRQCLGCLIVSHDLKHMTCATSTALGRLMVDLCVRKICTNVTYVLRYQLLGQYTFMNVFYAFLGIRNIVPCGVWVPAKRCRIRSPMFEDKPITVLEIRRFGWKLLLKLSLNACFLWLNPAIKAYSLQRHAPTAQ